MDFKVGDIVRLLSGGCKMVVSSVDAYWVLVVYHDKEGRPQSTKYVKSVLYKVSPGED